MNTWSNKLVLLWCLLLGACLPARAGLVLQENWHYVTANASHTSDASASFQPLSFSNLAHSTFATAVADARAFEDLTGGNNARVNLTYAFDFLLNDATWIALNDHLAGALFLGDTDRAHVDTFLQVINQRNNAVVASLPIRDHTRSGVEGTDSIDESTLFSQHLFLLPAGDYILLAGLNVSATATSGVGDDRMESAFSYTAGLAYAPEPSSLALVLLGGLSLLPLRRAARRSRAI